MFNRASHSSCGGLRRFHPLISGLVAGSPTAFSCGGLPPLDLAHPPRRFAIGAQALDRGLSDGPSQISPDPLLGRRRSHHHALSPRRGRIISRFGSSQWNVHPNDFLSRADIGLFHNAGEPGTCFLPSRETLGVRAGRIVGTGLPPDRWSREGAPVANGSRLREPTREGWIAERRIDRTAHPLDGRDLCVRKAGKSYACELLGSLRGVILREKRKVTLWGKPSPCETKTYPMSVTPSARHQAYNRQVGILGCLTKQARFLCPGGPCRKHHGRCGRYSGPPRLSWPMSHGARIPQAVLCRDDMAAVAGQDVLPNGDTGFRGRCPRAKAERSVGL